MPNLTTDPLRQTGTNGELPPLGLPARPHLDIRNAIKGDVSAGSITVHAGAAVQGQIDARAVVIHGSVSGVVRACSIAIGATGRIVGELHYGLLNIETGAEIAARCVPGRMIEPADALQEFGGMGRRHAG